MNFIYSTNKVQTCTKFGLCITFKTFHDDTLHSKQKFIKNCVTQIESDTEIPQNVY